MNMGGLRHLAKLVNKKSVDKKLFSELLKAKVGTNTIEFDGLKKVEEGKGEDAKKACQDKAMGVPKRERVRRHRDVTIICSLLEIKVKQKEEKEAQMKYR